MGALFTPESAASVLVIIDSALLTLASPRVSVSFLMALLYPAWTLHYQSPDSHYAYSTLLISGKAWLFNFNSLLY
jgi:hypothetical protein